VGEIGDRHHSVGRSMMTAVLFIIGRSSENEHAGIHRQRRRGEDGCQKILVR
jgi:hypothetical protein